MEFGKYKGQRLGQVPDSYWRWFRNQEWAASWPEYLAYAETVDE